MRSCVELPDTTPVNKPVIEFIAQLLHCAVRLAGLGETMDERDERRNAEWKAECVKLLCSSLQNEDPNIFDIESQLGELGIHESVRDERVRLVAAVAIVNIYKLATKAGAGATDFSFVLIRNRVPPTTKNIGRRWHSGWCTSLGCGAMGGLLCLHQTSACSPS